jgi:hypothetical protein
MCTTAAAFEIVTSPVAIEPASVFGLHYERGMFGPDVAREFRDAFKRAQKFGAFRGVKVSVTSRRFSGGSSVDVKILAAPFAANDPRKIERNIRRGLVGATVSTSDRMRLLVAQLEMLANIWRRDDSDSSTDYFNCNCYLSVTVGASDAEEYAAAHTRVAGASLRAAIASVDALSPLADDRPALAVESLARGDRAEAAALATAALADAAQTAPQSIEAHLSRAILAACERITRSPWEMGNAFADAMPSVRRAVELAGRTVEEARGVCDAAMAA